MKPKRKVKPTPQVHLVEDCGNAPGRILAVFAHREDADAFCAMLPYAQVVSRTLHYGQPSYQGFNP